MCLGGECGAGSACTWPALLVSVLLWCGVNCWGRGDGELSGLAGAVFAPLATPPCCAFPEKSRRASILGPMGIATLQPNGSDPEARLPHIQDTAARLLSPDEVTAVLRHCSRVCTKARVQAGHRQGSTATLGLSLESSCILRGMVSTLCPCLTLGGKPRNG